MWQNSHKIGEISTEINFGSILNIFKTQKIIYAYLWQNSHRIVEIFPEINFEYFQAQKINLYLFETKFALVLIWIFSDHRKSIYVYLCQNSSKMVEIFPFWIFSNHRFMLICDKIRTELLKYFPEIPEYFQITGTFCTQNSIIFPGSERPTSERPKL